MMATSETNRVTHMATFKYFNGDEALAAIAKLFRFT